MIARIAEGDKEDVDLAVKAARDAFDHGPWPRLPGYVSFFLIIYFIRLKLIILDHYTIYFNFATIDRQLDTIFSSNINQPL